MNEPAASTRPGDSSRATRFTLGKQNLIWLAVILVAGVIAIFAAQWFRGLEPVVAFEARYPGTAPTPEGTPVGIPDWARWQHFFNAFLMVLVLRTGWIIRRAERPPVFWMRKDRGLARLSGRKVRLGIFHWAHLVLDALLVLNGVIYLVLLFATDQWMRIVPTSWEVLPNAASALLQYISLEWPTENPWVYYNALQQLSYFVMVFIAAPLAVITGLRLSPRWPLDGPLSRILPERASRRLHGQVMFLFLGFMVLHVFLVFSTGALRNLNVMYAGNDSTTSWWGFVIFAMSAVVTLVGWLLLTPAILKRLAAPSGEIR